MFPSIRESFGVVQIEAMACGKPVVVTFNGGSEEIVTSESGILVIARDEVALSDAIERGLDKKWECMNIVNYSKKFSLEHVSKILANHYSEILKG